MPTPAQIEAARRNGAKSKGPVTAEGKQRSSRNATQHGLTAKGLFVLVNESDPAFLAFFAEFEAIFKPVDDMEREFLFHAAASRWRLRRACIIETGLLDMQMENDEAIMQKKSGNQEVDQGIRQAAAFKKLADESRALDLVGRYETRLSREYDRAIRAFDRVRAERNQNPPVAPPTPLENPEIEPAPPSAESEKLQNEPKPAEDPSRKLQNEPKESAEPVAGVLVVDPRYAGTLDKLLADPSVRAILDPPDKHSAA